MSQVAASGTEILKFGPLGVGGKALRRNGKTVKFWQQLGYEIDLDLGTSGRMVNAAGGPALFITEMSEDHVPTTQIAIRTDQEGWKPELPVEVTKDWHDSHWDTQIMNIKDPDGRSLLVQLGGD